MKSNLLIKLIVLLSALFIVSLFTWNLIDDNKTEVRNELLYQLITGAGSCWLLLGLSISILIWNVKRENEKETKGQSSFIILIVTIIIFFMTFFATFFTPPKGIDALVFQNSISASEKIICQYFEDGKPGSEEGNWRIIRTKHPNSLFRPIEIIEDSSLLHTLDLYSYPRYNAALERIKIGKAEYLLQKYSLMENFSTWKTFEIRR